MPPKANHERSNPAPDRFFLNEMKREINDFAGINLEDELAFAAGFIDIQRLGDVIEQGSAMEPVQMTDFLNSQRLLTNELWSYMNDCYGETFERRGYPGTDLRQAMVCLSSAVTRAAVVVDVVKRERLGDEGTTAFTNALISRLGMQAAKGIVGRNSDLIDSGSATFAAKLSDEAFQKTAIERHRRSWGWAKTHMVAESLTGFLSMHDVLKGLPELKTGDIEMLRRTNDALGESAGLLLTYTPKPAIGALENTDVQTLFVDRDVHMHTMISSVPAAHTTPVRLFPGTDLRGSNVSLQYGRAHQNQGGMAKRVKVEDLDGPVPQCEVVIYRGRELTLLGGHLEDFAQDIGAEGQATLLTSMLLTQNFDLTVPSYIVDLANDEADREPAQEGGEPVADKLRRLLVARTRVLQTLGADIASEMDREEHLSERAHRDIVKHGVVGHLRRLPGGYTPSQEARQLCLEELGVEIPEGHTYVKKHRRGNVDLPDRGHKMAPNPKALGRIGITR